MVEAKSEGPRSAGVDGVSWVELFAGLESGDTQALLGISRLITQSLVRLRAYDFRQEWPDLTQECLEALVRAVRDGRLHSPTALPGYVHVVVRNKFNDRLKRHIGANEDGQLPWDEAQETARGAVPGPGALEATSPDLALDVRRALDKLPDARRSAVIDVYVHGLTYEEAAHRSGVPLGTLKDALKHGLQALRAMLLTKT